jgi:hypothetical protein
MVIIIVKSHREEKKNKKKLWQEWELWNFLIGFHLD